MIVFHPPPVADAHLSILQKLAKSGFGGAVILIAMTTCLVLALQWGGSVHPWSDSRVWGLLLGFGLLAAFFIAMQIRQKEEYTHPLSCSLQDLTSTIEHSFPHASSHSAPSWSAVYSPHSCKWP